MTPESDNLLAEARAVLPKLTAAQRWAILDSPWAHRASRRALPRTLCALQRRGIIEADSLAYTLLGAKVRELLIAQGD